MSANLGIFDSKNLTLGRTETAPGFPLIRYVNPTDYDFAFENMRIRIKDTSTFWEGLDYLGLFGGDLRTFLTIYIELSVKYERAYVPNDLQWWLTTIDYNYPDKLEPDDTEKYLNTLYNLQKEGQVPKTVYAPFTYQAEKSTASDILKDVTGVDYTKLIIGAAVVAGIYAFAGGGFQSLLRRKK